MPGTMSQADLVADLKASLQAAARLFEAANDADFKRHLDQAALAFGYARPRTMVGTFTVVADQETYPDLPADFLFFKSSLWGVSPARGLMPWDRGWPGPLPDFFAVEEGGVRKIALRPAPTAQQVAILGTAYRYYYAAKQVIGAAAVDTTIRDGERQLLLVRAQAEAMRELVFRNISKPVQILEGMSSQPKNGMPSAIFDALMQEFERGVRAA